MMFLRNDWFELLNRQFNDILFLFGKVSFQNNEENQFLKQRLKGLEESAQQAASKAEIG